MSLPEQADAAVRRLETGYCIAGGGPSGMMLGYLLARAGVKVVVLEKHGDFLRDFRGDTVHPSTLEVMYELGLLERFLERPHTKVDQLSGQVGGTVVHLADFRHLPTHARFIALMPQWEFLDFLAGEARAFEEFTLIMCAEARELIVEGERVAGVMAAAPDGDLEIRADLTVAADGRHSMLREQAGLEVIDLGAPMDVLWMRLPRRPDDSDLPLGHIDAGRIFVMIPRDGYFQCGYVVAKGEYDAIRAEGLEALRQSIARLVPMMADRVGTLDDWDDVKLLTVSVDRLKQWSRPGLLCIGDAAHAMSPVGGVGINLAIQDAVAAANILAAPLAAGRVTPSDLLAVQRRREGPTRFIQGVQLFIQGRVIGPTLRGGGAPKVPWPVNLFNWFPVLRRVPARIVGLGLRFERVATRDVHRA
jgi:2-polyprenyl-6-methoxyphenol hydroxylase-like FAD-dependent oxidoreductase